MMVAHYKLITRYNKLTLRECVYVCVYTCVARVKKTISCLYVRMYVMISCTHSYDIDRDVCMYLFDELLEYS